MRLPISGRGWTFDPWDLADLSDRGVQEHVHAVAADLLMASKEPLALIPANSAVRTEATFHGSM